jgi:hypothetical protein
MVEFYCRKYGYNQHENKLADLQAAFVAAGGRLA